ncbi:MAG: 16S rRNA (guanine1207-N2)-methyltransferase [Lysobacterales bacterium]|jgi:16S rRNA (guanine1207-N2)-methyltransferase
MSPVAQLLLRNLKGIDPGSKIYWINPTADGSWQEITNSSAEISMLSQNYSDWNYLATAGANTEFSDFPSSIDKFDHVLLTLPHSKPRLEMMLDYVCSLLHKSGRLWLVGANNAGIRSAGGRLKKRFEQVRKLDSARHGCLFEAKRPITPMSFEPEQYQSKWQLEEELQHLTIYSWPGVFAHGRLDAGTRLLLSVLQSLGPFGKVLDFGCGCGVISARIADLDPSAQINMVDVDILALRSSRETANENDFEARITANDGFTGLDRDFDLIVSNPPFHQGQRTDMTMSIKLMDKIRNFLKPHGSVVLVVNRHLPYRRWLDDRFGQHTVLTQDSNYQVLRAVKTP